MVAFRIWRGLVELTTRRRASFPIFPRGLHHQECTRDRVRLSGADATRSAAGDLAKPNPAEAVPTAPTTSTATSATAAATRAELAAHPADVAAPVVLHGTFVGVDEQGVEQAALDGGFTLYFKRDSQSYKREIAVTSGRWTSDIADIDSIAFGDVLLGERAGHSDYEVIAVPPSGELALRCPLVPPSSLRVLDAVTRAPLSGIDLFIDPSELASCRLYPARLVAGAQMRPPVVAAASSPVTLPAREIAPVWWVHVAGYIWTRVQVQQQVGGERELLLERGGALALTLRDVTPNSGTTVSVMRGELGWREPVGDERTFERELADFPPGPCVIEARAGEIVLASTEAEVVAGQTTRVELTLAAAVPEPPWVPLRGTVVFAAADAALAQDVMFRIERTDGDLRQGTPLRDSFAVDRDRPGVIRFDFTVPARRYVVTVLPMQVHRLFELGPQGLTDVVIEIPALVDVQVEVVDRATGLPLADGSVSWRTADHPVPDRNFPQRAAATTDAKLTRFRAPPGRIVVQAWPDGFSPSEVEVDVRPPLERITVAVAREQSVRIVLRDGTANVPIDPGVLDFDLLRADGTSAKTGWAKEVATGALALTTAEPGDFTLKAPSVAGFAAIPARTVHVEPGGTTEVVIELVRQ